MAGVVPTATYTGGGSCAWLPVRGSCAAPSPSSTPGRPRPSRSRARLRADSRGKTVVNSIAAISDSVDPNPALATDTVSFVPIPAADLELTKVGPPDPVQPGDVGRYTFQFANRGPSNAPDVIMRDTLPDGLSFVGDTAGACSAAGQAVTCALGPLDAGAVGRTRRGRPRRPLARGGDRAQRRIDRGRAEPTRTSLRRRSCPPATPMPPTWSSRRSGLGTATAARAVAVAARARPAGRRPAAPHRREVRPRLRAPASVTSWSGRCASATPATRRRARST